MGTAILYRVCMHFTPVSRSKHSHVADDSTVVVQGDCRPFFNWFQFIYHSLEWSDDRCVHWTQSKHYQIVMNILQKSVVAYDISITSHRFIVSYRLGTLYIGCPPTLWTEFILVSEYESQHFVSTFAVLIKSHTCHGVICEKVFFFNCIYLCFAELRK